MESYALAQGSALPKAVDKKISRIDTDSSRLYSRYQDIITCAIK